MRKRNKKQVTECATRPAMTRGNRVAFMLNDEEMKAVNRFVAKYKIRNKSKWMRETLMASIFRQLSEDYPTLFAEHEMKR